MVGVQAQDVRGGGLALRSRVPGLRRADVDGSPLVRTWTLRGTVHLHDPADLPWLDCGARPAQPGPFRGRDATPGPVRGRFRAARRPGAVLAERPLDRASLLAELAGRGPPALGQPSVNVLMPWAAAQGLVAGLPDGRYRAAQPPPGVDGEAALATLARRYLAGYGQASAADLAWWSGLPLATARRALAAAGPTETAGELTRPARHVRRGAAGGAAGPAAGRLRHHHARLPPPRSRWSRADDMTAWSCPAADAAAGRPARRPGRGNLGDAGPGEGAQVPIEWFGDPAPSAELDAEIRRVEAFLVRPLALTLPMPKVNIFSAAMCAPTASSWSSQVSNSGPCRGRYQSSIACRSSASAGSRRSKPPARPCTVTASSSPGRWVALTAGRAARWRMRTEFRPELKSNDPCRK